MTTPAYTPPRVLTDHAAGLRYLSPLGPALPGLDAVGLEHVRQDALARAAAAERQADDAMTAGNLSLMHHCSGEASALRRVAAQIVRYAADPMWSVTP